MCDINFCIMTFNKNFKKLVDENCMLDKILKIKVKVKVTVHQYRIRVF